MSTISKMETPTGQEETAILLEEQARRIATLQESLKQACHNPHSNDRVIMQEVVRLVKERDDLKRRLENAELLIERLKREIKELDFSVALHERNAALRTAEESSVVDRTPAKQPDDSSNTDGDGDSVIDDNHLQVELDCEALRELIEKKLSQRVENIKKVISSPTLSPELAALGRELVRLAEKSLEEVEE